MIDNIYSGNYVKPFVMLDEAGWIPCISHLGSLQGLQYEKFLIPFDYESDAKNIANIIAKEQNEMIDSSIQCFLERNLKND